MLFTVWCHRRLRDALAAEVAAAKEAEKAWKVRTWIEVGLLNEEGRDVAMRPSRRKQLMKEVRRRHNRARNIGQLRGTVPAFLLPGLLEEMDRRGWLGRTWDPVEDGAIGPGRAWGAADQGFDARFVLVLPTPIGEDLRRACYWTSRPHVEFLQQWYDTHGDHWRGVLHSEHHWVGVGPTREQMRARDQAAAQVTNASEVLRLVAERAVRATG